MASSKTTRRLYRSEGDRLLGGVCGGVGEYLDVDPTLIRISFLLFVLIGGGGIFLYLVCWLIIPSKSQGTMVSEESVRENAKEIKKKAESMAKGRDIKYLIGLLLLFIGVSSLMDNFGYRFFNFWKLWPLGLIVLALMILRKK